MSIAGGLLPSEQLPKVKRDGAYTDVGDGKHIVLQNGMRLAKQWKSGDPVPPGYAVINIDHGLAVSDTGPVPVTHSDDTLVIPRGTDRLVPITHVNVLNDAVITEYFQSDLMSPLQPRHHRRFNFAVKQWPKTGDAAGLEVSDIDSSMESHEVVDLNQ